MGFRSWTEELQAFRPSPTSEKDGWEGGGGVKGKRFVLAVLRASLSNKVLQLQAMAKAPWFCSSGAEGYGSRAVSHGEHLARSSF